MSFSTMATGMEYESPYKSDYPFSYEVEEGELSSGSGRSSPGTVRDNASDCGTQTDDQMENISETVTTMSVHLDNTPQSTQTPQEIARKIKNKFDNRRNLQSFNTNKNTNDQGTSTNIHSYEHSRIVNIQNRSTTESYTSPPLPNYPPPVRPPPPSDYITEQPRTQSYNQQQLFTTNRRPNNLRFPNAVTPRSANSKSFFHQSTNERTPTTTVMETIWFQDKDPRTLNSPHNSNYNPLGCTEIGQICLSIHAKITFSWHLFITLKIVCQCISHLCHQKTLIQSSVVRKTWGETNSTRICTQYSNSFIA